MSVTIKLLQPYLAIHELTCPELPDFAVLTGRNGAGKTQLLRALLQGPAVVPGIRQDEIELYDMLSFQPTKNTPGDRNSNQLGRTTASDYIDGDQKPPPIAVAAEIFERFAGESERGGGKTQRDGFVHNLRERIRQTPDFDVFATTRTRGDISYEQSLHDRVWAPLIQRGKKRGANRQSRRDSFNGNPVSLISLAMKRVGKLPHELTRDDIMHASHYEGGVIANAISAVFASYKVDQYVWAHTQVETTAVPFRDLVAQYQRNYPPPWDMLRGVMARMREAAGDGGLFNFEFSDPADIRLDITNFHGFSFTTGMTNRTTGACYEPTALSSGEQVLMALCLASFNQHLGRRRPKLLLLDELDAVLHPSMLSALVEALKSLFVQHGSKILMTSHSPMTVAALKETEIFGVVRNGGQVRIARWPPVFHRSQPWRELA